MPKCTHARMNVSKEGKIGLSDFHPKSIPTSSHEQLTRIALKKLTENQVTVNVCLMEGPDIAAHATVEDTRHDARVGRHCIQKPEKIENLPSGEYDIYFFGSGEYTWTVVSPRGDTPSSEECCSICICTESEYMTEFEVPLAALLLVEKETLDEQNEYLRDPDNGNFHGKKGPLTHEKTIALLDMKRRTA